MKKYFAFFLIACMLLALSACGSTAPAAKTEAPSPAAPAPSAVAPAPVASPADAAPAKERLFGFTCMDMTNPGFIAMRDAMKADIEAKGGKLVAIDGAADQTKQNNAIEDMITQGIDVLFLNPVDSQSVQPALEACKAANIPVINIDSSVADTSLIVTFISSNNFQAGQLCGKEMVKLYPDGAKICIIENPLAESVVQRVLGLEDAIKGSKVEIVGRKAISTMDAVLSTTEDLLQANPDIKAFWGLNDPVSLAILGSIESAGMADQVRVFSVDGAPSAKKSISEGGLYATAAQSMIGMGKKAVECAYDLLDGKTIEPTYAIDTILVTPDNIQQIGIDSWS